MLAIFYTQGVGVLRESLTENDLVSTTLSTLSLPSRDLLESLLPVWDYRLFTEGTEDDHAWYEIAQRPQESTDLATCSNFRR